MTWKDDETLLNIVGPTTMEELEEFGYVIVERDKFEKLQTDNENMKRVLRTLRDDLQRLAWAVV